MYSDAEIDSFIKGLPKRAVDYFRFLVSSAIVFLRYTISIIKYYCRLISFILGIARPKVGLAIVIFNEKNEVLLGKRIGTKVGAGMWQFSGGHLEFGENFKECAEREVYEETGLHIWLIDTFHVSNEVYLNKYAHYVTVWLSAKAIEPNDLKQGLEPLKCKSWQWFPLENLPSPIFEGDKILTKLHDLRLAKSQS